MSYVVKYKSDNLPNLLILNYNTGHIMRILITSAHSHEGETGSAHISEILAKELSKKNQVLYILLGNKFEKEKITKNLTYLKLPIADLHGIKIPIITPINKRKIFKIIDDFQPQVVHSQNIIFGGLLGLIWARTRNVPYVLTLHHIPHEGLTFIFPRFKKRKIFIFLDRQYSKIYTGTFLKLADMVIALNKTVVESLKILSPNSRHVVINNGIELDKFKRLPINKPAGEIRFLYPGSYIDRKNQEYLVKTFRYLPNNYTLNLYGKKDTGFGYVTGLERLIKKYNIENVTINDYVESEELLKVYKNSHYLISASVKEVQSLVLIEALAAGRPVIALENEATKDLINEQNGIVFPQSTSPKEFAKGVEKVVVGMNNYTKISNACRKSVNKFDIKIVSVEIVRVYKNVINTHVNQSNNEKLFLLNVFMVISMSIGVVGRVLALSFF